MLVLGCLWKLVLYFASETCGTTIIPLVCKICQQAVQAEDATLPVVATQLGKLCHGIAGE